jgi:hypothetical protein
VDQPVLGVRSLLEADLGYGETGYFNSLSAALEVKARTRAVNDKITYAAEVQSVLRQLLHEVRNSLPTMLPK